MEISVGITYLKFCFIDNVSVLGLVGKHPCMYSNVLSDFFPQVKWLLVIL